MKQRVTVVIPAFNEEKIIEDMIKRTRPLCDDLIVALAKKSSDNTENILKSMNINYIKDNGIGKGEGIRCAVNTINEGILVFMDCDGSHIPEDIPKLVQPIKDDKADMVIASRFLGGSEELHGDFNKFLRMFFAMCIAQLMNWRFKVELMDTQNGFRAIKLDVAKALNLRAKRFEIETEIDTKCLKKGYRIMEVPSRELKRKYGASNLTITRDGWRFAWAFFRNIF